MKITIGQLRRIIKEEVLLVKRQKLAESRRRRLREGPMIGSPRALESEPPVDPPEEYWGEDEEERDEYDGEEPDVDYYEDDYNPYADNPPSYY